RTTASGEHHRLHAQCFQAAAPTPPDPPSLHDALPILPAWRPPGRVVPFSMSPTTTAPSPPTRRARGRRSAAGAACRSPGESGARSEEHTSELQSLRHLVCRLLLAKKKTPPDTSLPATA